MWGKANRDPCYCTVDRFLHGVWVSGSLSVAPGSASSVSGNELEVYVLRPTWDLLNLKLVVKPSNLCVTNLCSDLDARQKFENRCSWHSFFSVNLFKALFEAVKTSGKVRHPVFLLTVYLAIDASFSDEGDCLWELFRFTLLGNSCSYWWRVSFDLVSLLSR